jgi:S1-C subfamily serine protease
MTGTPRANFSVPLGQVAVLARLKIASAFALALSAMLCVTTPALADVTADAARKALEKHAPSLVRVEASVSLSIDGLPGLGEGARRTHDVSTAGVVVSADGLVLFPLRALDPSGDAFALLGSRPRADVLSISVVGQDGRVREAAWVGRDLASGLAFARVVEVGRAGLAPVAFGAASPQVGDPLFVLSLGPKRLGRPKALDQARVSYVASSAVGTTPRLPHALGALVTLEDGTPIGVLAPLADPDKVDLLVPDALADARAGHVLLGPTLAPLLQKPPTEAASAVAARGPRARAWLGVRHELLTPEVAKLRGIDVDIGIRVVEVWEGPAKVAGIQAGDVLQKLDGDPLDLESSESFDDLVEDLGVGTKVTFVVYRPGAQAKPVEVELKAGPVRPRDAERAPVPEAGLLLRQATFFDLVEAGLPAPTGAGALVGAVVLDLEPDGAAARAGLKTGDLVLKREGEPVTSLRDLRERLAAPGAQALTVRRRGGEELTLRVRR